MADDANTEAARQRAKALSRWEGEGGALGAPALAPTLEEEDMRILARLGAALLMEWDSVSEASRGAILEHASALHAERDAARIKGEIARFVGEHHGG